MGGGGPQKKASEPLRDPEPGPPGPGVVGGPMIPCGPFDKGECDGGGSPPGIGIGPPGPGGPTLGPRGDGPQGVLAGGGGQPPFHGSFEFVQHAAHEHGGGGRGGGWGCSIHLSTTAGPPPSTTFSMPPPPRYSVLYSKYFFGSGGCKS